MMTACGCMGPMYGEPHCYCTMKSMGLEKQMEANPLRIADTKQFRESMEKFFASGGFNKGSNEHKS